MSVAEDPYPSAQQVGWLRFGGLLVVLIGAFNVVNGLTGLLRETTFLVTPDGLLVSTDYKVWGGFWLGLGAVQVLVGLGVLGGRQWARVAAILLLLVAAVGQMLFLVAFPLWSLLTIGLIVAAIHALTVHGEAFGTRARGPGADRSGA